MIESPVQSGPAFPGGDGQNVTVRLQPGEQLRDAGKQREAVIAGQVVVAVAIDHGLVAIRRQVRHGVTHRIGQAEPDNMAGPAVFRHRQVEVAASGLDGEDDRPGRVE